MNMSRSAARTMATTDAAAAAAAPTAAHGEEASVAAADDTAAAAAPISSRLLTPHADQLLPPSPPTSPTKRREVDARSDDGSSGSVQHVDAGGVREDELSAGNVLETPVTSAVQVMALRDHLYSAVAAEADRNLELQENYQMQVDALRAKIAELAQEETTDLHKADSEIRALGAELQDTHDTLSSVRAAAARKETELSARVGLLQEEIVAAHTLVEQTELEAKETVTRAEAASRARSRQALESAGRAHAELEARARDLDAQARKDRHKQRLAVRDTQARLAREYASRATEVSVAGMRRALEHKASMSPLVNANATDAAGDGNSPPPPPPLLPPTAPLAPAPPLNASTGHSSPAATAAANAAAAAAAAATAASKITTLEQQLSTERILRAQLSEEVVSLRSDLSALSLRHAQSASIAEAARSMKLRVRELESAAARAATERAEELAAWEDKLGEARRELLLVKEKARAAENMSAERERHGYERGVSELEQELRELRKAVSMQRERVCAEMRPAIDTLRAELQGQAALLAASETKEREARAQCESLSRKLREARTTRRQRRQQHVADGDGNNESDVDERAGKNEDADEDRHWAEASRVMADVTAGGRWADERRRLERTLADMQTESQRLRSSCTEWRGRAERAEEALLRAHAESQRAVRIAEEDANDARNELQRVAARLLALQQASKTNAGGQVKAERQPRRRMPRSPASPSPASSEEGEQEEGQEAWSRKSAEEDYETKNDVMNEHKSKFWRNSAWQRKSSGRRDGRSSPSRSGVLLGGAGAVIQANVQLRQALEASQRQLSAAKERVADLQWQGKMLRHDNATFRRNRLHEDSMHTRTFRTSSRAPGGQFAEPVPLATSEMSATSAAGGIEPAVATDLPASAAEAAWSPPHPSPVRGSTLAEYTNNTRTLSQAVAAGRSLRARLEASTHALRRQTHMIADGTMLRSGSVTSSSPTGRVLWRADAASSRLLHRTATATAVRRGDTTTRSVIVTPARRGEASSASASGAGASGVYTVAVGTTRRVGPQDVLDTDAEALALSLNPTGYYPPFLEGKDI